MTVLLLVLFVTEKLASEVRNIGQRWNWVSGSRVTGSMTLNWVISRSGCGPVSPFYVYSGVWLAEIKYVYVCM